MTTIEDHRLRHGMQTLGIGQKSKYSGYSGCDHRIDGARPPAVTDMDSLCLTCHWCKRDEMSSVQIYNVKEDLEERAALHERHSGETANVTPLYFVAQETHRNHRLH